MTFTGLFDRSALSLLMQPYLRLSAINEDENALDEMEAQRLIT